ncbi:phage tail protein [Streptomyces sp. NPDC057101]|uniref:phage tail protein n=1 Tax=Streptomyces sp. NPDC057101 TaxID=3346020 RepID=UPI0036354A00
MQLNKVVKSTSKWGDWFFGSVNMAFNFTVAIDQYDYELGDWASVSGLNVSWQTTEYRTGDNWNYPMLLPGVPKYQKIKLSRAACPDSEIVQQWLTETSLKSELLSGSIALVNSVGVRTVSWELREFFPAAWGIGEFNAGQGKVAMETLELVHTGFLNDNFAPGRPGAF